MGVGSAIVAACAHLVATKKLPQNRGSLHSPSDPANDWCSAARAFASAATPGQAPSPRRESLPDITAAIVTTIAISSHDAAGTTRNTNPVFALRGPKARAP